MTPFLSEWIQALVWTDDRDKVLQQNSPNAGARRDHRAVFGKKQDDITDTQESIQKRVLAYFCKRKFIDKDEMMKMLSYENSGFSLDAKVKIPAFDKDGLER